VCTRYRGNVSTGALPSSDRRIFTEPSRYLATTGGYTYTQTDGSNFLIRPIRWVVVPYVPSFIKIGSGVQKRMGGGGDIQTHREQRDLISLIYFFTIRKVG
jgi:hypothetical protein